MTRLTNLRTKMKDQQIDALLVTDTRNVTYLSGFTGDESVLLIGPKQAYFITDSRYTEQAAQQVQDFEIIEYHQGLFAEVNRLAVADQLNAVAFEATHMSYAEYTRLQQVLAGISLQPISGVIEQLREVKDAHEIELIKQAIKITDDCFDFLLGYVQPGMTEKSVATEMDYFMRQHGASGTSFETIVASGYRSAWPHGTASEKQIANGELVTFDFGCYYQGYASDMTRTIAVGDPGAEAKKIYQIVLEANRQVVEVCKPGATGQLINDTAHNYVASQGYSFGHGTGHGIGLDIHEGPGAWGIYNAQPLVPGNVVTDEPGIYVENLGGVRIEDDLLITKSGCEVLTKSPKDELVIL